jgi:hypothetical protein
MKTLTTKELSVEAGVTVSVMRARVRYHARELTRYRCGSVHRFEWRKRGVVRAILGIGGKLIPASV